MLGISSMHTPDKIRSVGNIYSAGQTDLPDRPGVYAFWWIGEKSRLMEADRHITLKGPGQRPVDVEYRDWWPTELAYPCLYVGKSTNVKNRFTQHIMRNRPGRLHQTLPDNHKVKPVTTSCQLRYRIEHVFRAEPNPLAIIFRDVGFYCRFDFRQCCGGAIL